MTETRTMHKAEKYAVNRRALTEDARQFLLQNFGCNRKVYNLYTDWLYQRLEETGYEGGERIPTFKLPEVSEFKKQYPYLKEADSLGLANTKIAFEQAVRHYNEDCDHKSYTKRALRRAGSGTEELSFRGLRGMPKFHSRAHGDFSYKTNCQYPTEGSGLKQATVRLEGNKLYLPKWKDGIELTVHRALPDNAKIGNVTMSMDTDGRFYAAVEYEYSMEISTDLRQAVTEEDTERLKELKILGLDYSQGSFYVDSDGRKANYPHYYRRMEEKLAREQRKLSRMENGSQNWKRQLVTVQKVHKKIRNQRKDFVYKKALELSREYDTVAVEDLDLRQTAQEKQLGKNLHDNGFGMFRTALAQKLDAKGSVLVKVDRYFPSTKVCHCCGTYVPSIELETREWICPGCGETHDRDINAAINIREEGKRIFGETFLKQMEEEEKAKRRAQIRSEYRHQKKTKEKA